ncbi:hypothetical protein Spico_0071 [Parasphaerochaeta coccoides DSM 17374]|uniref:Flavodoxin-like domain-containing protein n=2 Tax=Parasphaerochaeta TaxID=3062336 RepID=F4GJ18_PARC1|nr:hypothetical protein Spico_0071 [Parasphaerochaeta coccoides DSM 17374]
MKRCSIIIHSTTGNCFIMGSHLKDSFAEMGFDARLYRVKDDDLHILANTLESTNDFYEDIISLGEATISTLIKSSLIILGSPSRFGNVTPEMNAFMDTAWPLKESGELEGKFFGCFTSSSDETDEPSRALETMAHWAQSLGMIHIPYGTQIKPGVPAQPPQGVVHRAGKDGTIRPAQSMGKALEVYAHTMAKIVTPQN